ncbi:dgoA [Symbiodinium sp. CCMP2592]|nr:dgoA [Symbiodinium sp. CCMP2592]
MSSKDVQVRWTAALRSCPLVAILRGVAPTEAAHVGKALAESGLTIVEVPLNSPQALQSIALLVQHLPNAIVGAGTVLSAKEVDEVHAVGGKLIVSPNMDPVVIRRTKELGLISFPGVCTPTEAFAAIRAGADALKAFPGEQLPPNIIKAWRAVLPQTTCLMPVGGVSTENMAAYLEAGASGFGVGTALYQAGDTADTCRKKAQAFLRKYRELAKDVPVAEVEPPAKRPRGATTSFSFHVKLSRSHEDEKWGFFWDPEILKQSNRRVLRSIVAAPGSPFDMWNHENPHLAAVEGDELVQVNEGGKSAPDIARELKQLEAVCEFVRELDSAFARGPEHLPEEKRHGEFLATRTFPPMRFGSTCDASIFFGLRLTGGCFSLASPPRVHVLLGRPIQQGVSYAFGITVQNPSSQSSQEEQLMWMVRTRDSSDLVVEESSGGAAWLDASASDSPGKMWGLSTSALDAPTLRWGELLPFYITLNTASVTVLPIQVPFDLSMPMRLTAPLGWIWEPAVVGSGFWQDAAFGSTAALPGRAVPTVSEEIFLSWTTPMAFVSGEIYGFRVPVRVPRWSSTGADFLLELGNWSGTADAGQRPLAVLLPGPSLSAVRGAWVDYVTGRVGEQHGVRVQLTTTTPIFAGGGFIFEGGVATRRLRCSCPGVTDGYTCAVQSLFSGEILLRIVSTRALLAGTYAFLFLCTNPPNTVPAGSWRFATYQDPENYPDATEVDTPSTVPGFAVQEALQHFERLSAAITWSFDPRPLRDSSTILAFTLPGNGALPSRARLRGPEGMKLKLHCMPQIVVDLGQVFQLDVSLAANYTQLPELSTVWDWNKICAYHTNRVVRIQDANLGYLYWGIVTLVVLYIQIVVFHIEGRHTFQEPGYGAVITKFEAKSFNQDGKAFDEVDLRHPVIEPSGAFIMTRRITMKGQAMGTCVDSDSPQTCPCGDHATCGSDNYCQVKTWCPSLGDHNVANPPPGAVVEDIFGLEEALLMIVAGIGFPSIGAKFHVAGSSPDSSDLHKRITLLQLLELADPPLKLEDVSKSGCVIAVNFFWSCDFSWSNSCEPKMSVKRVDDGTGFVQKRSKKHTMNGVETRDAQYMYGLRLIVDSSGIGRQISLVPIVIQLGSCLALVQIASMAADFLMVRMYDKDRCEAYYRCKVVETKDYSEMQERLHLVGDQRSRAREMVSAGIIRSGGAGAGVSLGLGAGGRGSMSTVRGRNVPRG